MNAIYDEFLTSLIEGSSDAIFVAEVETGKLAYANPAAGRMFECASAELVGKHQTSLHPIESVDDVLKKFKEFSISQQYKEVVTHILTAGGKRKLVLISGAATFQQNGITYSSAYFKDISHVEDLRRVIFEQSHFVRRPLANILAITRFLEDGDYDSEAERRELCRSIFDEALTLHRSLEPAAYMINN